MGSVAEHATFLLFNLSAVLLVFADMGSAGKRGRQNYFKGLIVILSEKTLSGCLGCFVVSAEFAGTFKKVHSRLREVGPAPIL